MAAGEAKPNHGERPGNEPSRHRRLQLSNAPLFHRFSGAMNARAAASADDARADPSGHSRDELSSEAMSLQREREDRR
jgi:hypothetical protein